jgi:hypothetical protein
VAPPSVHPNGRRYEWLNSLPIAYAPHWLRLLLAPPPPKPVVAWEAFGSNASGDGLVRFVATSAEGNRNKALYWAVKKATTQGVIDQIRADLEAAAIGTGLAESAVKATIKSGIKAARKSQ